MFIFMFELISKWNTKSFCEKRRKKRKDMILIFYSDKIGHKPDVRVDFCFTVIFYLWCVWKMDKDSVIFSRFYFCIPVVKLWVKLYTKQMQKDILIYTFLFFFVFDCTGPLELYVWMILTMNFYAGRVNTFKILCIRPKKKMNNGREFCKTISIVLFYHVIR